jgi:hypothetical protein
MSDFSGFFAAIEKALFEVATWVFLIPKTLYLVLSHPSKVPEYVRSELSARDDSRARFHGTVSPLLLFLLVALGPFLLMQLVPELAKAPIEGERTGFVGSQSKFKADYEKIPRADWMKITWSVGSVDSEGGVWNWTYKENCFREREPTECEFVESVLSGEADPDQEPGALVDEAWTIS